MPQVIYPATFDGNDLTAVPGLTILSINSYLPPKRSVVSIDLARTSQSKISTGFYNQKDIAVRIGISRDTRANAEESKQTLMGLIQGLEKYLIVKEAGADRRYTATYADFVVAQSGGSYIEGTLIFTCSDRFGYSLVYEKLLDVTGRTLYNYTDSFTLGGNVSQAPVITAFLSALAGATTNAVIIGNVATGQFITVSRAWTAGDRLVIDVLNRTVKVNGTNVDFTGAFPEFAAGVGYLNYQDNFTSRTLALSAYYNRRYI